MGSREGCSEQATNHPGRREDILRTDTCTPPSSHKTAETMDAKKLETTHTGVSREKEKTGVLVPIWGKSASQKRTSHSSDDLPHLLPGETRAGTMTGQ